MSKLTLSIDKEIIKKAKKLAKEQGTSVSSMFSRLIQSMAKTNHQTPEIGPLTRELSGIMNVPTKKSPDEILSESLLEKHEIQE